MRIVVAKDYEEMSRRAAKIAKRANDISISRIVRARRLIAHRNFLTINRTNPASSIDIERT